MNLSAEQWLLVQSLLENPASSLARRGRPRVDDRAVLDGILWVLRTGSAWSALPPAYPPFQTCHRRYLQWTREGKMSSILAILARHLQERGGLDLPRLLQEGKIKMARDECGRWVLTRPPELKDAWQWSTALIYIIPFLKSLRRRLRQDKWS